MDETWSYRSVRLRPMQRNCGFLALSIIGLAALLASKPARAAIKVTVNWEKIDRLSKTTPTLQVVVNPPLRRGSAIHDRVFQALRDLGADYVRYVPWLPYPRLGVAELEPPKNGKTSWDFSLIDPMTEDFMNAAAGRSVILNFSIIPQWMFKTEKPVSYPGGPDQVTWDYQKGTEFRDPSLKEVADYYARLVSWYVKGGFTDEYGLRHESGHRYKLPYWEILNEVDFEHQMTPETYTRVYDAVASAIRQVSPETKFVGMALAQPSKAPAWFEYFLDHRHHQAGVPLNMISYHFYAVPDDIEDPSVWPYTFFEQADHFLDVVRYIEAVRSRLSPETKTTIDELGCILPADNVVPRSAIPESYWNLCGATYAYLYSQLAQLGIDVAGQSQMVGYPTQFPSVTMVDWNTGQPNARYWVLKLIHDHFGPGDELAHSEVDTSDIYAQGFITHDGKRELMLVNRRSNTAILSVPGAAGGEVSYVDETTRLNPPAAIKLPGDEVSLGAFAVAVVTLPKATRQ